MSYLYENHLHSEFDINIPMEEKDKLECKICGKTANSINALPGHIGAKHGVKFEDYLVKYFMSNKRPVCPICSGPTRYLRGEYCFKKYCVAHAKEARSAAAKHKGFGKNGFDVKWKTGKTKYDDSSIAAQAEKIIGKNNPSFMPEEEYQNKKNSLQALSINLITSYECFSGNSMMVKAECSLCNRIIQKTFVNLMDNPTCPSCTNGKSKEEKEVFEFVYQLDNDVRRSVRSILNGLELDIYCENKKIAIEYNGLFWHTEDKIGKKYHSIKTEKCLENGIKLIHIFSDEWSNKKEIVKSILSHKFGMNKKVINTRKMILAETDVNKTLINFFDTCHISGHAQYTKAFYLIDPTTKEIVAALSLRKPFVSKYGKQTIEIARYATKLNCSVPGGFSRLLKNAILWCKIQQYDKIMTYADLRYGDGKVYLNTGFEFTGKTDLDYWYTDTKVRSNRFQYRAQNGKTEKEIALENGVKKIYGCGSNIWIKDLIVA